MSDLVDSLVSDLSPVRPVRLASVIVQTLAVELAAVLATAWLLGARIAGPERLGDPSFLLLLATLGAGAAGSAFAMSALAIPGRSISRVSRALVLGLPLLLAVGILVLSPWGSSVHGLAAVLVEGFGCTRNTILVAIPAWLAGLVLLRRLRPLDPLRVGVFASLAALFAAALVVQMACPSCESWHLAVSHYVPILVAAWAGALAAPLVLRSGR